MENGEEEVAGVVSVLDHGETEPGISSGNGDVVAEEGSVEVSKLQPPRCGYYEKQICGSCAIPILASSCISDEAMKEAYRRVSRCMRHQPRALKRLIQAGAGALQSPHCIPCHIWHIWHISHSLTVVLMLDCLFLSCLTLVPVHVVGLAPHRAAHHSKECWYQHSAGMEALGGRRERAIR